MVKNKKRPAEAKTGTPKKKNKMDDIPTSNKFDALTEEDSNYLTSDDEAEMQQNRSTDLQPPTKKEKISPIVVTNSGLSSEIKAEIHLNMIKKPCGDHTQLYKLSNNHLPKN